MRALAPAERPFFHLVPACIERADGTGPAVDLGRDHAQLLRLSISIDFVTESEKLAVSVWGSADGKNWEDEPLVALPPKYYCGEYSTFLDLTEHPEVRYLRVTWNMARCLKSDRAAPQFGFRVTAEPCDHDYANPAAAR